MSSETQIVRVFIINFLHCFSSPDISQNIIKIREARSNCEKIQEAMLFHLVLVLVLQTNVLAMINWTVTVDVRKVRDPLTDAGFLFRIFGTEGNTTAIHLLGNVNRSAKSRTYTYHFSTQDIGLPQKINIGAGHYDYFWSESVTQIALSRTDLDHPYTWVFDCYCSLTNFGNIRSYRLRLAHGPCPKGLHLYLPDASCVKTFDLKQTFEEARKECQKHTGDLVKIHDEEKNKFVIDKMKEDFDGKVQWTWIGVNQSNMTYKHINGDALSYKPWWSGYPTPDKDGCGQMMLRGGWITWWCHMEEAYTCQKMAVTRALSSSQ